MTTETDTLAQTAMKAIKDLAGSTKVQLFVVEELLTVMLVVATVLARKYGLGDVISQSLVEDVVLLALGKAGVGVSVLTAARAHVDARVSSAQVLAAGARPALVGLTADAVRDAAGVEAHPEAHVAALIDGPVPPIPSVEAPAMDVSPTSSAAGTTSPA